MLYLLTIYIGFYLYFVDIYSHSHIPTQVDIYRVDTSKFSSRSQNLSASKIPWHLTVLVRGHQQRGSEDGLCPAAQWAHHWPLELETKVIRRFSKISQSRRNPRLGPTPGWVCLLALSHLRHYAKRVLTSWPHSKGPFTNDVATLNNQLVTQKDDERWQEGTKGHQKR